MSHYYFQTHHGTTKPKSKNVRFKVKENNLTTGRGKNVAIQCKLILVYQVTTIIIIAKFQGATHSKSLCYVYLPLSSFLHTSL